MKTKSFSDMQCSIARTLEQVGSWWSLLVIREAMMGARRFKHFEAALGIAKNTLTSRLNELVENGILEKGPAKDGSSYEEYTLTQKGRELGPVMMALAQWGDKWAQHKNG
ncbi:MAG: helix-turn-helix domain-containing protein, partial [Pseudomonadota bacterium]